MNNYPASDKSVTRTPESIGRTIRSGIASWTTVALTGLVVTGCTVQTTDTTRGRPDTIPTRPSYQDIQTGFQSFEAEPVQEVEETDRTTSVPATAPPEEIDPARYGFESLSEMKRAVKEAMGIPSGVRIYLVADERDDKEGLSVIGAGYTARGDTLEE